MISLDDGIESTGSSVFYIHISFSHLSTWLVQEAAKSCFLLLRGFRLKVWWFLTLHIFGLEWLSMMLCI